MSKEKESRPELESDRLPTWPGPRIIDAIRETVPEHIGDKIILVNVGEKS